jgi:ATPase subunit of ABC transporter with duplicated ATPase domains
VISTANLTIQFGAKPLFENVSIKFGEGNRYGLIGANGSGKSTFMKILGGDLEPSSGTVTLLPGVRMATLQQNQFGYETFSVIDTVIMGHKELWNVKEERDKIYAMPEMSEDDGMRVAELEVQFAEMDGYSAEARAGELLLGAKWHQETSFVCCLCRPCSPILIYCYLTSQPTIWTSTPFGGLNRCSMSATAP